MTSITVRNGEQLRKDFVWQGYVILHRFLEPEVVRDTAVEIE